MHRARQIESIFRTSALVKKNSQIWLDWIIFWKSFSQFSSFNFFLLNVNSTTQSTVKEYNNVTKQCCFEKAIRLLLLKCYHRKMIKLPGCSFIGASSCS